MKYILVLFLWFSLACNSSKKEPVEQVPAVSKNSYEKVIRDYFDAFNTYNWQKFAGFYVDSAEFLDPEFGTDYVKKSHNDIVTKYTGMQK